jgi:hypothetical protein
MGVELRGWRRFCGTFVRDKLGIAIKDTILPLSSTPLCLPPFWLAAGRLLALA